MAAPSTSAGTILALKVDQSYGRDSAWLKTDLHLHSSEDPADVITHDAYTLIDKAVELGFDALALTLHDRQLTEPRVFDYARDHGVTLLPGVERTIEGRHVLLLNFPQGTEQVRTFADLARLKSRGKRAS